MGTKKKGKSATSRRRRLGRGLTSLISTPVAIDVAETSTPAPSPVDVDPTSSRKAPTLLGLPDTDSTQVQYLPLDDIQPNPGQPRRHFDVTSLNQLAESIRQAGLMQPILVRPNQDGGYELVAGERRWRAARTAGLDPIPAIVRSLDDETCAEWSLIENLQREDLNPIERAEAFRHLVDEYRLTHENLARRVGLDRSSITNHLRLNELDALCKSAVREGRLSMGHAKVLLGITNLERRQQLSAQSAKGDWSVRQLEQATRAMPRGARPGPDRESPGGSLIPPQIESLQRRLGDHLGTKVRIIGGRKKGAGRLVIDFFSLDHFENLMQTLQFPLDDQVE